MRAFLWITFTFLAVLWSAGAWIAVEVTQWMAGMLALGPAAAGVPGAAVLPLPDWIRVWVDPAWLEMFQSLTRWAFRIAGQGVPAAVSAAPWIVTAIWIVWGVGMFGLLLLTWLLDLLVRPGQRPQGA